MKWQDTIVTFNGIAEWAGEGAPDPHSGRTVLESSPLDPQKRAVRLIHDDIFERRW
ncbi:hypothetical protein [Candidatus Rariloculus sp.]|uniref:hypothetical protein n=1 Tax=Candidatus Rariloculus sp. TaxID=3101265 RepID=UPI003D106A47